LAVVPNLNIEYHCTQGSYRHRALLVGICPEMVAGLAKAPGGEYDASRPVVDSEWIEPTREVATKTARKDFSTLIHAKLVKWQFKAPG
jgi:hypothetical protein